MPGVVVPVVCVGDDRTDQSKAQICMKFADFLFVGALDDFDKPPPPSVPYDVQKVRLLLLLCQEMTKTRAMEQPQPRSVQYNQVCPKFTALTELSVFFG